MKVKLNDVLDGLEMVNQDRNFYYNPETEEIFFTNIWNFDEDDEELLEKSIMLPTQYHIDEYSIMEEFIETVKDIRLQNQLYISINGKGAFRRFKDTCINFDIIDDWYKFRNKKYKEIAIRWCMKNNIEFE